MEKVVLELDVDSSGAGTGIGNLKQQLKAATLDAQALAEKFGATSKEAIKAAQRAAQLKEEIADVRDTINALNPEAKFNSIVAVGQGIAGGFAAAQGAMALFGAESEDVQKALLKVQAAMALSSGLNDIRGLSDGFKNLSIVIKSSTIYTKLATAAQATYNFVVGTGSSALKLFRLALAATGIGAVIVGIVMLYQNWDKLTKFVEKNSETIKKWGLMILDALLLPVRPLISLYKGITQLAGGFDIVKEVVNIVGEKFSWLKDKIVELLTSVGVLSTAEEKQADARLEQSKSKERVIKKEIELAKALGATEEEMAALEVKLAREKFLAYNEYIIARKKAGRDLTQDEKEQYEDLAQALKISKAEETKSIQDAGKNEIEENKKKSEKLKAERKRAAEEQEKIDMQLQDLTISNIRNERKRELKELELSFERKIAAIIGNSAKEIAIKEQLSIAEQTATNLLKEKFAQEDRQKKIESIRADYEAKNIELETQKLEADTKQADTSAIEIEQARLKLEQDLANEELTREQKLLSLAQYENTRTKIEKTEGEKRLANQKKIEDAKYSIANSVVQGISALNSLMTKDGEKQSKISKALAVVQLGIDTAKAISATIAGATQAAAAGGPAAPVLLVGYIASGIATVLGNFASAKKLLGDSSSSGSAPSSIGGSSAVAASGSVEAPRLSSPQGPQTQLTQQEKQFSVTVNAQVVETDMTKSQNRIKDIEDKSTI